MNKKIYFMLLSVFLSVTYLSAQVVQTIAVPQGGGLATAIGSNLKTVTDLTITGTINATDFATIKQMTALKNLNMLKVVVDNNTIPANAFQSIVMNSLSLPSSISSIEESAFLNASLSQKLILPPNISIIKSQTFRGFKCPELDLSLTEKTLVEIGGGAFYQSGVSELNLLNHLNLKTFSSITNYGTFTGYGGSVILPQNLERLNDWMFLEFRGTVKLPPTLETIGKNVFQSSVMTSLSLPSSISSIEESAFLNASLSQKLILPPNISIIKSQTFRGFKCPELDLSLIEKTLVEIGGGAFYQSGVSELNLLNHLNLKTFSSITNYGTFTGYGGSVILPQNLERLNDWMFLEFRGTVKLPSTLETIGKNAFQSSVMTSLSLPSSISSIEESAFLNASLSQKLILPPNISIIKSQTFRGFKCPELDLSLIEKTLVEIGGGAFYQSGVSELNLLNHLNLKTFSSITNYGTFTGYGGSVILPQNLERLNDWMFLEFRGTVKLPSTLETIGKNAFQSSVMTSLSLPSSISSIEESAFLNASLSQKLILPPNISIIKSQTFRGFKCPELDLSLTEKTLVEIGGGAFYQSGVSELNLLNHLNLKTFSSITNYGTFTGYGGSVILPQNLERLNDWMFLEFRGTVKLPSTLETIGKNAFQSSVMTSLSLPSSISSIEESAFLNASLSQKLILPPNISIIKSQTFRGFKCPELDLSLTEKTLVEIGGGAFYQSGVSELNLLNHLNLKTFSSITNYGTFTGYGGSVILPQNLERLNDWMFLEFRGTVKLPPTLETIGKSAFQSSTITSIDLPSTLTSIGENAFYNATKLEKIVSRNATPPALGSNVFYGVNKTTCTLYIPYQGIPLYQAANQWKDFIMSTYSLNMRLDGTNLYQVNTREKFSVKMALDLSSDIRLGLYSLSGTFVEDITQSVEENAIICQTSIEGGNYIIVPYKLVNAKRELISRDSASSAIDRLPIEVINNWNVRSTRSAVINNNLLFATGTAGLLEVENGQTFNILVRYMNATSALKVGLFDIFSGLLVADVTESVKENNFTCKVPAGVAPGNYSLIPYKLVFGVPVIVERSAAMPYLVDRLPFTVKSVETTTRSLIQNNTTDASVTLYPNPVQDVLNISGEGVEKVSIYDISGRQVSTAKNVNTISVSDLSKGTYLVRVLTANGESTHKVIKK